MAGGDTEMMASIFRLAIHESKIFCRPKRPAQRHVIYSQEGLFYSADDNRHLEPDHALKPVDYEPDEELQPPKATVSPRKRTS